MCSSEDDELLEELEQRLSASYGELIVSQSNNRSQNWR